MVTVTIYSKDYSSKLFQSEGDNYTVNESNDTLTVSIYKEGCEEVLSFNSHNCNLRIESTEDSE